MPDPEHTKALAYELAHRALAQVIVETGVFILIALTALVGNSCVLYVFYKSSELRSVTSYYIITLAISDVVMALIVMPTTAASCAYGRDVVGFQAGQVIGFIGYSLVFGSLETTCLIAINRFFCMVKPFVYRKYFKPKPAILMIIGCWLFSISFVAFFYFSKIGTIQYSPAQCSHFLIFRDKIADVLFRVSPSLLFIAFPLSITAACYWKVYRVVKGHNAAISSTLNAGPAGNIPSLTREEISITKSVLALVCGFVICWIPNNIVFNLSAFVNLPRRVEMIVIYTVYASSAINPFVFNIFNKAFRKQFIKVFGLAKQDVEVANEGNTRQRASSYGMDITSTNNI